MAGATILVPLDGSKLAESSLLYLPALSPLGSFDVELITAEDPDVQRLTSEQAWDARSYLQKTADKLTQRTGLAVKCLNPKAIPYAAILAESENPRISMIVITTHGLTGFERWRIGSVADKVIRGAPCPTLIIGRLASGAPPAFTRILVPLDGSKLAEEALPVAKMLAERLNAGIRLVRALTPRTAPDEMAGSVSADVVESSDLVAGQYLDEVRLEMETSQSVETAVETGPAAEVILSQAENGPCDLVVMTSHGRHGLVRFAIGSVTERLIEASPVPVLVVRPGQGERLQQFGT